MGSAINPAIDATSIHFKGNSNFKGNRKGKGREKCIFRAAACSRIRRLMATGEEPVSLALEFNFSARCWECRHRLQCGMHSTAPDGLECRRRPSKYCRLGSTLALYTRRPPFPVASPIPAAYRRAIEFSALS